MVMVRNMVSMAKTPAEVAEEVAESTYPKSPAAIAADVSKYPYGLCLALTEEEMEKMGLDYSDVEVGDTIHLFAFAKVTSVSARETQGGKNCCRVELQITDLEVDDEDHEAPAEAAGEDKGEGAEGAEK